MMIKAQGARWLWMKAKNQKLEMFLSLNRARSPPVRQWRLNRSPNIKWHHLPIVEHQMTSAPDRRTPNDIDSLSFSSTVPSSLVWFPPKQDCEPTIPMSFLFIVSFKTGPSELLCVWSHFRVVMYMKLFQSCYVYEVISKLLCIWSYSVYDESFLYSIKRVVPFTNSIFLHNNCFLNWCYWQ